MLDYFGTQLKSYEERYEEAISRIPLYTQDWTNFNASDPGITILENLTGFETLQQNRFEDIPFAVRRNLLKILGFSASKGRMARLLLSAGGVKDKITLAQNHKFHIGRLVFETNRQVELDDYHLLGIFGKIEDEFTEFPGLLDRETFVPQPIFGKHPEAGNALYLIANHLPESGREINFFVRLAEYFKRNPVDEKAGNSFASIRFEVFTTQGFKEMKVRDMTHAFLNSGEIRMRIPADLEPAVYKEAPKEGYCIRMVLESAEYDVYPKCLSFSAFLFEVWQKNTLSECHTFQKPGDVEFSSVLMREAYVDIFCKEEKGSSYRRYTFTTGGPSHRGRQGRFYEREDLEDGRVRIRFNPQAYGFGPEKLKNCVKAVIYTEPVMRTYSLDKVLGYDDQEITLPFSRIVPDSFCIIAKRKNHQGEEIYDFVRPDHYEEGALTYHLLENDGKILIEDAGDFIGADLYLGSIALTAGPDGNIREGNMLVSEPRIKNVYFYNPAPGTGGVYRERLEAVRDRFVRDMEKPYAAVTSDDYERIVMETPGLCIHKAKAFMDEERNLVKISVKPGTDEEQPRLTDSYRKIIEKRLDERRLLTTRIEVLSPVYTRVDVFATVYVKLYYENSKEQIEKVIRGKTDYVNSHENFGDVLRFDEVFHAIELLDCVDYVYDLSLRPQSPFFAKFHDGDIYPVQTCLLIPGTSPVATPTDDK